MRVIVGSLCEGCPAAEELICPRTASATVHGGELRPDFLMKAHGRDHLTLTRVRRPVTSPSMAAKPASLMAAEQSTSVPDSHTVGGRAKSAEGITLGLWALSSADCDRRVRHVGRYWSIWESFECAGQRR